MESIARKVKRRNYKPTDSCIVCAERQGRRKEGVPHGMFKKMKNTFPVIELVLYWGDSRWRSGRDLRQLFRKRKITKEEWKYIDELKLHVFEMRMK